MVQSGDALIPAGKPRRCRHCHRPIPKGASYDGVGSRCAEDAGLVPMRRGWRSRSGRQRTNRPCSTWPTGTRVRPPIGRLVQVTSGRYRPANEESHVEGLPHQGVVVDLRRRSAGQHRPSVNVDAGKEPFLLRRFRWSISALVGCLPCRALVTRTLDNLDRVGLRHTGSARSARQAATPNVFDVRGMKVAQLSYTFSFNGIERPPGQAWIANLIDPKAILAGAHRAREAGAEIVIASLHGVPSTGPRPTRARSDWPTRSSPVPTST